MRLTRTRLLGLLSAFVIAIPALAFAQPGYLCRITGQISDSSCCSSEHSKPCGPEVTRASCCRLLPAEATLAPSVTPETSRAVAVPVVVAILDHLAGAAVDATPPRALARLIHPPGPPRFLVKCSFLI